MSKKWREYVIDEKIKSYTFDTSNKTNDTNTMKNEKDNNQGRSAQYALKAIKSHLDNLLSQGAISEEMYEEAKEIHGAMVKAFIKKEFGLE